ncbi:CRISPR-associated endonuclease/helicase Cas3 [Caballeronia pedi]|uniref:CRISPR-associated endonuclease/helicase Cas3 n=2 Tax=Caballeronia pedi TaxID=1777141 RepID=A0A158AU82_9BURK|nr:CRISPR-associated endonuclease/helicase Cas3 [Caballeronia pedi]
MLDVAACFMEIAHCGRIHAALCAAAGRPLSEQDIERLAALAYLHDFGKANSGFQAKRWKGPAPREWPQKTGHGAEALYAFGCGEALLSGLRMEAIWDWGGGVEELLLASLGHHGRPVQEPSRVDPLIWQPVRDAAGREMYSPANALKEIGNALRRHFPFAFNPGGEPLPSRPAFIHLFAGLVQLADWLGSDLSFFEYSSPGSERRLEDTRDRASKAVGAIGLETSALREQLIREGFSFQSAFGMKAPHPAQSALGEKDLGPLLILESETGSGKTEAALWRFAKLFEAGKVDSLYFALPTRVAAAQVYERVRAFVARLWPTNAPVVVRALPGYESADGNVKEAALPDFQVLWTDHPDDATAHQRWAAESPKRFLAATIAVGTIDQALLAALKVRHAHLRHATLCRSLLVVDEVHASDTYMSQVLEQLLKAHHATGGHALLLSATLGSSQRARFQGITSGGREVAALGIEEAVGSPYPALTDGAIVQALPTSGEPKTVHWQTLNAIDDHERIARLAFDAAKQGARVLIIRNTVPAAIATQKAVEALVNASGDRAWLFDHNGIPTLHHSRFSRQDRPHLDARVEERVGKVREPMQACIVVGTQTLEQSLDIDADMLITDICPMDVLLQRIGRLHRHERKKHERPVGLRQARAWVLIPESGSFEACLEKPRNGLGRLKDGGGVYPDLRMIEATRRLICAQPSREIPRENRSLVERATHPDCLRAIQQELGASWEQLSQQLEGGKSAERVIARDHALPYDTRFDKLAFPDGEERVATRLGAADRLVEFDPPERGPFGTDVHQIAIRHHMLPRGLDADAKPASIVRFDGGFEFGLGTARYSYSRFGIEKI